MQRDVGVKVAEDMSEFLLAHNGELQHGVVIRLRARAEPQRSEEPDSAGRRLRMARTQFYRFEKQKSRGRILLQIFNNTNLAGELEVFN